jgi:hypothetical protein
MKTPADFATSPAIVALNVITSVAALAGAVNVMAVKAEATCATSPNLTNQNEMPAAIIDYDSAAQKSTVLQFGGKATFTTTNTQSYTIGQPYGTDDAKTVQD